MDQRNEELLSKFKQQLEKGDYTHTQDLFTNASLMPASRFFVSEQRTLVVIHQLLRGESIAGMNRKRRQMYNEIFVRVKYILHNEPERSIPNAVWRVVNSPAPEFYLTPGSARRIIYRLRRNKNNGNTNSAPRPIASHLISND